MTTEPPASAQGRIAGVAHASRPPAHVLRQLRAADALCHCIPGAKSVEPDDGDRYAVRIEGSVGPFEACIDGNLTVTMDAEGDRCRLLANGSSDGSSGEIDIAVRVDPSDDGCSIVYEGTIVVTGNAATMGDRVVETIANMLGRLFFEGIAESEPAAVAPPVAETPIPPRLGLNPQIWVPGLCVTLVLLVLMFRI